MMKTLVMDFLALKPEFSRRLSRIFFSASSRLSRNFRGRLAGLAQIAAAGRLSRRLRGLGPAPCGRPHRKLKLESTDDILSSSHAKKLVSFLPEFRLWTGKK